MKITAVETVFPLAEVFTISRGSRTEARVVTVTVERDGITGWGECVPYARYDETVDSVLAEIMALEADFANGLDRKVLQSKLEGGAARNALDCALWDWEAKNAGERASVMAGVPHIGPEITAYTLSLADADTMRAKAAEHAHRPLLKVKLGGEGDLARLRAVREGAPNTDIIIDANEGWDAATYTELAPVLVELGVKMVEQPMPAGDDEVLATLDRILPVCADESCHDRASLPDLAGKYDMVNIKLDKTGGLTEALALKRDAIAAGFDVMVGCMVGSSLAMAPATLLAQGAAFTDLDGPLLLAEDRDNALHFDERGVHPPEPALWG
ncbi:N-acetyl-D-Glu racemase DgcA [Ahrensia sp. R2A130]|uniref:N-acetyl-D-Glu racemase DgcA n=1 Tax=Ahrensia sp. R2A130 TaxID=744979 RepID=UPI0001E09C90|nr:N-acetyl-D-Glu racemase DgcA [Ahrensia sp. R2A130]EFL88389.1 chain X, L-Ala-DL-Glu Epimerase [Ahrensia sp. R2A130]